VLGFNIGGHARGALVRRYSRCAAPPALAPPTPSPYLAGHPIPTHTHSHHCTSPPPWDAATRCTPTACRTSTHLAARSLRLRWPISAPATQQPWRQQPALGESSGLGWWGPGLRPGGEKL